MRPKCAHVRHYRQGGGYSFCSCCGNTWDKMVPHTTWYSISGGCFPLCELCWSLLTIEERLPHYEALVSKWNGKYRDEILAAVRSGL
jgi:hypothetical protein